MTTTQFTEMIPDHPDFECAFTGNGRLCDRCYKLSQAGREVAVKARPGCTEAKCGCPSNYCHCPCHLGRVPRGC